MVSLVDLWLPILISAVLVFVASSVIHMLFGWHRSDFKQLASEDAVMARGSKLSLTVLGDNSMGRNLAVWFLTASSR
jgi:hypothetical protein